MNLKLMKIIEEKFSDLLTVNTERLNKLQKIAKLLHKNSLNKHFMNNHYLIKSLTYKIMKKL
jgi:hypothetical protein